MANPSGRPNNEDDEVIVWWLLEQPGGDKFSFTALFEALREQPAMLEKRPEYVECAVAFAERHGIERPRVSMRGRPVVRFYRAEA